MAMAIFFARAIPAGRTVELILLLVLVHFREGGLQVHGRGRAQPLSIRTARVSAVVEPRFPVAVDDLLQGPTRALAGQHPLAPVHALHLQVAFLDKRFHLVGRGVGQVRSRAAIAAQIAIQAIDQDGRLALVHHGRQTIQVVVDDVRALDLAGQVADGRVPALGRALQSTRR